MPIHSVESFAGMGTKMQCESYLLGYSSMRNLNEGSSSSWSPYYEDRTLNEHLYDSFMLRPEYSGYDKEMLKRTILEHEATFRKQTCLCEHQKLSWSHSAHGSRLRARVEPKSGKARVYELHRLYRTQKDLMDELKRQEIYKLPVHSAISQSHFFPSGVTSEATGRTWQLLHQTEASIGFNTDSVADTEDIKLSLNLMKENHMQFTPISRKNGVSLQNGELSDPRLNGCPKRIIDLELPADVYLDIEESCRVENEHIFKPLCRSGDNSSITCDIEHENDVKLTLGTSASHGKGSWSSDSVRQSGQSIQSCDYLNEAEKGLGSKKQSGFFSDHFLVEGTNPGEVHGHRLPSGSNLNLLPGDFVTDKDGDGGACSNVFDADKGKGRQEWPLFNNENTGGHGNRVDSFTLHLSSEKSPEPSPPLELKVKGEHHVSSYDDEDSPFVDLNNSVPTNSRAPSPHLAIPFSEHTSCASPVVTVRRRPPRAITHIPIAVQALPCFPASELLNSRGRKREQPIKNSTDALNKLHADGLRGGIEASASRNGCHQDFWSDSNSSPQVKHSSDSSVYENTEGCASQKPPKLRSDVNFGSSLQNGTREDRKLDESSEGPSWPRTEPSRTNVLGEFSCSKSLNQSPENLPSSSQVKESRNETNRTSYSTIIDLNTTEFSAEDEVPSTAATGKVVCEIDLHVPTPSYETPDALAAENLVGMSCGLTQSLAPSSCDSLHWFANLVVSEEAKPEHDNGDGEDVFESLTLQLEEMMPDEYLPQPQEQESQEDEIDTGVASLLLTKTRRGQLRKRRQKKDFQKDVLPGLVSLSRHEVAEDFQAFDCLMRAMGEVWESALIRRSTGRKGFTGHGRGRHRRRNPTVSVAEKRSSPLPVQRPAGEQSMIGWGRTTRRGRRPRVRPGNAIVAVA